MILDESVADRIEADMCAWLDKLLSKFGSARTSPDRSANRFMPFHRALLPKQFSRMSSFERSFSTLLGNSYERHSAIIAESKFAEAELQHKTQGSVLESVDVEISDEVGRINAGHELPDYFDVVERVVGMEERGGGRRVDRSVTSDLYLKRRDGTEAFFELKSPKPNKEQCLNITRKHLWIHAMLKASHRTVRTYFGMAYNPYGEGNEYRHSFAVKHLDLGRQTLIGKKYWDFLGGDGTYEELMEIYHRVGSVKSKEISAVMELT